LLILFHFFTPARRKNSKVPPKHPYVSFPDLILIHIGW